MPEIDKAMLARYAELAGIVREAEKEMESIKEHIVGLMSTGDMRKIETSQGVFTLAERPTWKYSAVVEEMQEKLKELKKTEEASGVAKAQTSHYLTFKG